MMKNKNLLPISLLGICSFMFLGSLNSSYNQVFASNKPQLETHNLILDMYAEYDFNLLNYNENLTYTWESSDTSLATLTDGHLSCLGKTGEFVVTVKVGKEKDTCNVSLKNQMINPSISVEDCLGFVNVEIFPEVQVRYDGNYYPITDYTLKSKDTSVATISPNGGFIGQQVGEVDIEVNATWKGKTLKAKKFTATIQPENSIVLDKNTYDIYSVDETSPVRKNYVDINASIFMRGQQVEEDIVIDLGGNPYLSANGNRITNIAKYDESTPLTVEADVKCASNPSVSTKATIVLHSNYESKVASEEITETYRADIEFGYEEFKGHPNAYKYRITDHELNKNTTNPTWSAWDTRIEFYETTTKNGIVSYDYMMEKGYTILAFDFYYCGQKGVLMGAYGATAKQYFYNEVQVNRTDMLLVNEAGVATNILTNDQWYTVYFDISEIVLKSMTTGQDAASLYVGPCYINDVAYFDNIRYYYDYSVLNDIEIGFDNNPRELVLDQTNPNKATSSNEMVVYSPSYVSFENNAETGLSTYDSTGSPILDRESRSKINAYNLLNGYAVNKGYKYLAFSYMYTSGSPILYYFNNYTNTYKNMILDTNASANNFVSFYADGKPATSIVANKVYTVVVRIDGKVVDSLYLSSSVDTKFSIGNYVYYKDTSYLQDYSNLSPFKVVVDNVDIAFVGDVIDLSKHVSVIYNGKAIRNPHLTGFMFSNRKGLLQEGANVLLKEVGQLNIDFIIRAEGASTKSSITIMIKEDSLLSLPESRVALYAGDKDYFEKEYSIQPFAIFNKTLIESANLNYELVNDNGVIELTNNRVKALKEGVEQVKVSLPDNSQSVTFEVEVFNKYRRGSFEIVSLDATSPATYSKVNQTVEGVVNPYMYQSSTASWNNKLDISETSHLNPSVSKNNIINTHIDFITYEFMLTAGSWVRAASVNPSGSHTNVTLQVGTFTNANNTNITVTDLEGNSVTSLKANTWYRLVLDYSNFKNQYKSGFTCHELVYLKGTMYVSDIRYYHDSIN